VRFGNRSQLWQMAVDAALIAGAWYLAYWLRFDHGIPAPYSRLFEETIYIVVPLKLAVFILFGLYSHWWRYVSIRDMWSVLRAVLVACLVAELAVYLINPVPGFRVPRGVFALDLLLLLGAARRP
jgi:FlaA1/EpsC-like NDP-sugar epimerase